MTLEWFVNISDLRQDLSPTSHTRPNVSMMLTSHYNTVRRQRSQF
ncbi:hypothetical protein CEV33_3905 [Brucella grignonensis]|uniref:Uncharacterized protein n=1 Tax=Brucella grignonensis TaxID=94627 RepID=A0A256FRS3_9HYPH|nr:hypothetical protein CEV33_3905 [Brucella grignonensis]